MPGLALYCSPDISPDSALAAGDESNLKDGYRSQLLFGDSGRSLIISTCSGYPYAVYDTDDSFIAVEGLIYNQAEGSTEKNLRMIAANFIRGADFRGDIKSFIESADGDFLVVIISKATSQVLIFNDQLGRLPTFYNHTETGLILARQMKFILPFGRDYAVNRAAVAEFVSLGYILSDRSIVAGIDFVPPGSMIRVDRKDRSLEFEISLIAPIDFSMDNSQYSRSRLLGDISDLLSQAIADRVMRLETTDLMLTADLSGGFDSRTVVAGLDRTRADFTVCHDKIYTGDESAVAVRFAEKIGRELKIFTADHPLEDIDEMARLIFETDGLVDGITTVACFYDDMGREPHFDGYRANFMGLGAGNIRHPFRWKQGYDSVVAMMNDTAFPGMIDIETVCRIVSRDKRQFLDGVEKRVQRMAGFDWSAQIKYIFFARRFYQFAGEHRHRLFNWTVQPFWDKRLVFYMYRYLPPKWCNDRFFVELMRRIDPRTTSVAVHGKSCRPDTWIGLSRLGWESRLKGLIRDNRWPYKFYRCLSRNFRAGDVDTGLRRLIGRHLAGRFEESELLRESFDYRLVREYIESCRQRRDIYRLITPILYMSEIERRFL